LVAVLDFEHSATSHETGSTKRRKKPLPGEGLNRKEQLWHRAVSLRQHGFLFFPADVGNQLNVRPIAMVEDDTLMTQMCHGLVCIQDGSNVDS